MSCKKAIVVGASSGIGKAIAQRLALEGYEVGLMSRRISLLEDLQKEINVKSFIQFVDVTCDIEAKKAFESLVQKMGRVDLVVVNAGVFHENTAFKWEKEKSTIEVNVLGFAAMAHSAMEYFLTQGHGHLVGISSISAIRGEGSTPSYNASKAFVSNFLEGLRLKGFKAKKNIWVTDIQPGWVETDMTKGCETFWMASAEKAARQIYDAIKTRRARAYITHRWRLYAWLLKLSPNWFYQRFL